MPVVCLETVPEAAAVLPFEALTLDGEPAATLDVDLLEETLVTDVPVVCPREVVDTLAALPVLLAVAMPPLVETLLVKTLSAPVL